MKAILFDCWYTLFSNKTRYLHTIAERSGVPFDYDFIRLLEESLMLEPWDDLAVRFEYLLKQLGKPDKKLAYELQKLFLSTRKDQDIYPETEQVLHELKGNYKLAMLTNTTLITLTSLREQYPIDTWFDVIIPSYDVHVIKPDPRIYDYALEKLGIPPYEALMVGDSYEADYLGAKAAGLHAVLLDRSEKHTDVEERIGSLLELKDYLRRYS